VEVAVPRGALVVARVLRDFFPGNFARLDGLLTPIRASARVLLLGRGRA
jgi:hypothetical protein